MEYLTWKCNFLIRTFNARQDRMQIAGIISFQIEKKISNGIKKIPVILAIPTWHATFSMYGTPKVE